MLDDRLCLVGIIGQIQQILKLGFFLGTTLISWQSHLWSTPARHHLLTAASALSPLSPSDNDYKRDAKDKAHDGHEVFRRV
ncbi:MAG: hypothetical protein R2867_04255 [Caldilineaceae bacterium]